MLKIAYWLSVLMGGATAIMLALVLIIDGLGWLLFAVVASYFIARVLKGAIEI